MKRQELLNHLWDFQNKYGYIRDEDVDLIASQLGVSKIDIEGIISFYHFFYRKPTGRYIIYLNNSIISENKGFARVKTAFERETGQRFGEPDPSEKFALFETACIGLSDQEPAALINFYPFTNLNSLKVRSIIAQLRKGMDVLEICDQIPSQINIDPNHPVSMLSKPYLPGAAISKLVGATPLDIIESIKKSRLSGMGGAFFSTGQKWQYCHDEKSKTKYVVCNADEGEPGTFKDRVLLQSLPGLVLEGMAIAGFAIGASQGYIYLRAEYRWLQAKIEQTIQHFRRMNLLGRNIHGIKGFHFDIEIQLGAGAYVCGEETAMLNSMEGKRGEPRTKLFFPTQKGFLNKPTVVNNVETLCAAARIIELSPEVYLQTGTAASPGTKLISISGDCHRPGVFEIEWGTSIRELLDLVEADDPYFVQISGPSGECISKKEFDRTISKEDIKCGGSFMIFNRNRDLLEIFSNFAKFFKHESCGLCTPCRAGNYIIQRKLHTLQQGLGLQKDLDDLKNWGGIMKIASRCGLGKAATNSVTMALEKFPQYFDTRITSNQTGNNESFRLDKAVEAYEKFKG